MNNAIGMSKANGSQSPSERPQPGLWSAGVNRSRKLGTQPLHMGIDALQGEKAQLEQVLSQAMAVLEHHRPIVARLNEGGYGPAPYWQERWREAVLAVIGLRNAMRYAVLGEPELVFVDAAEMTDAAAVMAADNVELRQRFTAVRKILSLHDAAILAALDGDADHVGYWSNKYDQAVSVLNGLFQTLSAALQ